MFCTAVYDLAIRSVKGKPFSDGTDRRVTSTAVSSQKQHNSHRVSYLERTLTELM